MLKNFLQIMAIISLMLTIVQCQKGEKVETDRVLLTTSLGAIQLQLDPEKAPLSATNFKSYIREGYYDNTIFHRVIPNFVVQAGGWTEDLREKPSREPIQNEAANGLKNLRGTISCARTNDPNSATTHFFINLVDNTSLDYENRPPGYAVFGKVVSGMDVIDKIAAVQTGVKGGHRDVPIEPIFILSAKIVME